MLTRAVTLFFCFVTSAALIARATDFEPPRERVSLATLPMELGGWHGRQLPPFDDETLAVLGVDDYLTRAYFGPRAVAGLYVGYWGSQRQGDTIHSPLNCLPGAGWEPLSKGILDIEVAGGRKISVNRYVVQKGLDRELVLYWYQSHGRVVASEYLGKIFLVADAIRTHRTDAALVRVTLHIADATGGEDHAEREGVRFVKSLFPALNGYLPS